MSRWMRFFIAILLGLSLGLAYGWLVRPVRYGDTAPQTLSIDYRTDYVLMVAEVYQNEADLPLAVQRLALLGNQPATAFIQQAIQFAEKVGYMPTDLERMRMLLNDLQTLESTPGGPTP